VDTPISVAKGLDLDRLEAAVRDLADRYLAQRDELAKLRSEIGVRDRRVEELEKEVRRLQQSRRDVVRRIDGLIDQISRLEGRPLAPTDAP